MEIQCTDTLFVFEDESMQKPTNTYSVEQITLYFFLV